MIDTRKQLLRAIDMMEEEIDLIDEKQKEADDLEEITRLECRRSFVRQQLTDLKAVKKHHE